MAAWPQDKARLAQPLAQLNAPQVTNFRKGTNCWKVRPTFSETNQLACREAFLMVLCSNRTSDTRRKQKHIQGSLQVKVKLESGKMLLVRIWKCTSSVGVRMTQLVITWGGQSWPLATSLRDGLPDFANPPLSLGFVWISRLLGVRSNNLVLGCSCCGHISQEGRKPCSLRKQTKKKKDLESTRKFILYKDTKLWEQKASFPTNGFLHLELEWRGVRAWN